MIVNIYFRIFLSSFLVYLIIPFLYYLEGETDILFLIVLSTSAFLLFNIMGIIFVKMGWLNVTNQKVFSQKNFINYFNVFYKNILKYIFITFVVFIIFIGLIITLGTLFSLGIINLLIFIVLGILNFLISSLICFKLIKSLKLKEN